MFTSVFPWGSGTRVGWPRLALSALPHRSPPLAPDVLTSDRDQNLDRVKFYHQPSNAKPDLLCRVCTEGRVIHCCHTYHVLKTNRVTYYSEFLLREDTEHWLMVKLWLVQVRSWRINGWEQMGWQQKSGWWQLIFRYQSARRVQNAQTQVQFPLDM